MKPDHRLSQAYILFEEIKKGGAKLLQEYINSNTPTFETDYLDFKSAHHLTGKEKKEDSENNIKKIWSESLSGFANSGGGVIVWGVDAKQKERDDGQKVDCANGLSLVHGVDAFKSRLKELQTRLTDPPVANVEIESFTVSGDDGFVVCYIPASKFAPHRAEGAGKNYYIRAGESFCVASTSMLRRLFYPEHHAVIVPELRACIRDQGKAVQVECYLRNDGVATARDVVFMVSAVCDVDRSMSGGFDCRTPWVRYENQSDVRGSAFLINTPLHIGAVTRSCYYIQHVVAVSDIRVIHFDMSIYSDNNEPLIYTADFLGDDFVKAVAKKAKYNWNESGLIEPSAE